MDYIHSRSSFDYGTVGHRTLALKPNGLLTAGEVAIATGETEVQQCIPMYREDIGWDVAVLTDDEIAESELDVYEGYEWDTILSDSSLREAWFSAEMFNDDLESVVDCKSKGGYRFFDEPEYRSGSDIIADLQETALPLDKPIQFERTTAIAGSLTSGVLTPHLELSADATTFVSQARNVPFSWEGDTYWICAFNWNHELGVGRRKWFTGKSYGDPAMVVFNIEPEDIFESSWQPANGHC